VEFVIGVAVIILGVNGEGDLVDREVLFATDLVWVSYFNIHQNIIIGVIYVTDEIFLVTALVEDYK
jgi:hypothetical protein